MSDEGNVEASVAAERRKGRERGGRGGRRAGRRRIGGLSDHVHLVADRGRDVERREIVQHDELVGQVETCSDGVVDENVAIEIGAGERDDDRSIGKLRA